MPSEKWSNPMVCLVPMSWPTEYARHLDVRTTSIYPLPKMSPDRALGKGVAIKIMDGYSISHPKLVEHLRAIAEREDISYQMEILPAGGTDAGGVQRLHGGIPAVTLSIPCRYVHTPNEMVSATDVEAAITLLARYLEEASDADYAL